MEEISIFVCHEAPIPWPHIRRLTDTLWHTLCEQCGDDLSASSVGGAISQHAAHITRKHSQ